MPRHRISSCFVGLRKAIYADPRLAVGMNLLLALEMDVLDIHTVFPRQGFVENSWVVIGGSLLEIIPATEEKR